MSLFPKVSPILFDEKDKYLQDQMTDFYNNAISKNTEFWSQAALDSRFECGDQSVFNSYYYNNIPIINKKTFQFNRIRRITEVVSGFQRRNRKSTIVIPVETGDQITADQFTKILMHINRNCGVLETISDAFNSALVTGLSFLYLWNDFRSDPISGDLKLDLCDYNTFLVDPYFKKKDLSDCNFIWKRAFVSARECISMLPNKKREILELSNTGFNDDKFNFMPEAFGLDSYYDKKNRLLTYDEFYYKTSRTQTLLVDKRTSETFEWRGEQENLDEYMRNFKNDTFIINNDIPTINMSILVNGKVMYDGPNLLGTDSYPFVPVFGYFNPQLPEYSLKIQGVVRGLRDSQYLYNRTTAIILDILESQINSGWKYKASALVNPDDIFLVGQGKGLAVKDEYNLSDIEKIMPTEASQSLFQMQTLLSKESMEISGVNEELLGSAMDDKAGVLSMLRQGAGLTTLQTLFDQLDYSQKLLGKLEIEAIQNNYTPAKIARIIEEEPSPFFYKKTFGKYDAAVEEGVNTTTQKQLQFTQLVNLKEVGVKITDEDLLKASTIQNKTEIIENLKQQQQQEAMLQQQQMQAQMELQKAQTNLAHARSQADYGLGVERMSRVQENRALAEERRAEAVKDEQQAVLNLVKSLKEIDNIDIDQIKKLLDLTMLIKQQESDNKPII